MSNGGDPDVCPVCLFPLEGDEKGAMCMPVCGHKIHTICALGAAQYDLRCAVCRVQDPTIHQRDAVDVASDTHASRIYILHAGTRSNRAQLQHSAQSPYVVDASVQVDEEAEQLAQTHRRTIQRYKRQRRHAIRNDSSLADLECAIKDEQRAYKERTRYMQLVWRRMQASLWKFSPELNTVKKERLRAQRRCAALQRQMRRMLHDRLGPDPTFPLILVQSE